MPNPQYNKFLKQIRDNDPTRENGFVANILETPKAKEERLREHRFSALKLYHEECLREKAQREAQEAANVVRAESKARRDAERSRCGQEAKAKAARAGVFHLESSKIEAACPARQLGSDSFSERVRTLEGEIDHLSGRNAELESRIEAMKLETDSLKQRNSDLSEKRGNVLDEEAVKGILSRLCLDAHMSPRPKKRFNALRRSMAKESTCFPPHGNRLERSTTTAMVGVCFRFS